MIPRRLYFVLLASLLPGASFAQSDAASEAEIIPSYDVEIVVFKNIKVPKDREFVLPVSSPGKNDPVFDISSGASVTEAGEFSYELLTADDFRLQEIVARLIGSSRYELLLHAAWRQPGLERGKVIPVWIRGGRIFGKDYTSIDNSIELIDNKAEGSAAADGEAKAFEFDEQSLESQELQLLNQQQTQQHEGLYELEGKITVALSRYLHSYIDLVLRRPRLSDEVAQNNAPEEAYLQANLADTRILNNHLLREHRRMRSKNLHYIDSPEFGMLILITPYEVAEGFEEAVIEEEPEGETAIAE